MAYITPKIPGFTSDIAALAERGEIYLNDQSDPHFRLHAECLGGLARLTVTDLSVEGQGVIIDGLSLRAQEDEIVALREILGVLPMPIWRSGAEGAVLWANEAYLALASEISGDDLVWPLPVLFVLPDPMPPVAPSQSGLSLLDPRVPASVGSIAPRMFPTARPCGARRQPTQSFGPSGPWVNSSRP